MTDAPSRQQIIEEIRNDERDIIEDADKVEARDPYDVEVVHLASNGSVGLRYSYHKGYECTTGGGVYEVDILEDKQ